MSPVTKKKNPINQWQANFFAGLAIVLPAVISIAIVLWLFEGVSNITNSLLLPVPSKYKYVDGARGEIHWYWSLVALLLALFLIGMVGRFARHYIGKKLIELMDIVLLQVPLLNKIYAAIKQVNQAFSASNKTAFRQVALVQFPRSGYYSIGFITGDQHQEVQAKTREKVISIFVPTTPNPTTGFLIMVPEKEVVVLDMSVAEGIKFIISLGSIAPDYGALNPPSTGSTTGSLPSIVPSPVVGKTHAAH
ncbi:MAG TPA: DUF502 domain-containing protein [Methylomirabilota bacterium]|nr:DUF502 domain-containing protein [Methylomirabilota bacterium]